MKSRVRDDRGNELLAFERGSESGLGRLTPLPLPGETPRQAAVRELAEETAVLTEELGYVGAASFRLAPDGRHEHAAVFRAELSGDLPTRAPDDEVDATAWWRPGTVLAGLAPLDAWLATEVAR